jgi:hypothetical protein
MAQILDAIQKALAGESDVNISTRLVKDLIGFKRCVRRLGRD